MTKWVLNTIAFDQLLRAGSLKQADIPGLLADFNFSAIEYRSEYFAADEDYQALAQAGQAADLAIFLSIPDKLFLDGRLNDQIENYFKLGQAVGASQIKLNLGLYFEEMVGPEIDRIQELVKNYEIKLVVENDQTQATGSTEYFHDFMINYGFIGLATCFDVGNFLYIDENPLAAWNRLKDQTAYMHLKQVEKASLTTLFGLQAGDVPLKAILNQVPADLPVALEAAYQADQVNDVLAGLKADLQLLTD
ncbi:hypothetical protein AWM75_02520 [Aerococcus urinaehominis]|uniref:Uncharacterized protein n=1 Tax=Aerococcus urinaehominis TaxID=128944 RepID=A0A0X8FKJ8_9LACT|nr:hypothetical protein [Aerococcus urinaehominis]AMB98937.1 hypothetical protein AWM75_02520 [Aerococcus urinaehominis]SDM40398.1 Sugar phosphate isomerase/epimerase [Aerococcus urinaehominis]